MMCEDEKLLFEQYRTIATTCPDYKGETSDDAVNATIIHISLYAIRKAITAVALRPLRKYMNLFLLPITKNANGLFSNATILSITLSYTTCAATYHSRWCTSL